MTQAKLAAEVVIFTKELELPAKRSPMLRHVHFKSLAKAAEARRGKERDTVMLKILHREVVRK